MDSQGLGPRVAEFITVPLRLCRERRGAAAIFKRQLTPSLITQRAKSANLTKSKRRRRFSHPILPLSSSRRRCGRRA
jgi:hypothetical protein